MLKSLHVHNFAIIEDLTLDLHPGLNVFTGETGAGKSIIFSALSVLLGGRLSPELLRSGAQQGRVEALFDLTTLPRRLELEDAEGPPEEMLMSRTFSQGKSRASMNGALATASRLKQIGESLVNFHGQHQHQRLLDVRAHLEVLDAVGGLTERAETFREAYLAYQDVRRQMHELQEAERHRLQRQDLLDFQIREIEDAGIDAGELDHLQQERSVLQHAARLGEESGSLVETLYEAEDSLLARLSAAARKLGKLVDLDARLARWHSELEAAQLQIDETARELQQYAAQIEHNPARLEEVEERIELLRGLQRKYGNGLSEVLAHLESIKTERAQLATAEERLNELAREAARRQADLHRRAAELSQQRRQCAQQFVQQVCEELQGLRMQGASLEVRFHPAASSAGEVVELDGTAYALSEHGIDDVELFFAPNVGEGAKPLARIASGGELSRLMLAIKTLTAEADDVPCLVFDEVDAGIGGETAAVVGEKLKAVAARHQVLCITHLPQIAVLADAHYCIEKQVHGARTRTEVRELRGDERVDEIARMASGESVSAATRKYARELLKAARASR